MQSLHAWLYHSSRVGKKLILHPPVLVIMLLLSSSNVQLIQIKWSKINSQNTFNTLLILVINDLIYTKLVIILFNLFIFPSFSFSYFSFSTNLIVSLLNSSIFGESLVSDYCWTLLCCSDNNIFLKNIFFTLSQHQN